MNKELFDQVTDLLIEQPDFWNQLRLQAGGEMLTHPSTQMPRHDEYFKEQEWKKIISLYEQTSIYDCNYSVYRYRNGDEECSAAYIRYSYLLPVPEGENIAPVVQIIYVQSKESMKYLMNRYDDIIWQDGMWFAVRIK